MVNSACGFPNQKQRNILNELIISNDNNDLISVHPWYGSSPDIKVK